MKTIILLSAEVFWEGVWIAVSQELVNEGARDHHPRDGQCAVQ